jgi:2'-N-acetylparomamine deacetylase
MKTWIFLSTHFDDVVLSAGGMVWELPQRGDKAEIWTIAAGDPTPGRPLSDYAKMLHGFWELGDDVPAKRAIEDAACCKVLGAGYRRYTVQDAIYRFYPGTDKPIIELPDDFNKDPEPIESYMIPPVTDWLKKNIPEGTEVVAPLSIGNHRDHVITRRAVDRLGYPVWHYVDYPYIIQGEYNLKDWVPESAEKLEVKITPAGLKAWQDGFAQQHSQIILFWPDENEMRKAIEDYFIKGWGYTIWKF